MHLQAEILQIIYSGTSLSGHLCQGFSPKLVISIYSDLCNKDTSPWTAVVSLNSVVNREVLLYIVFRIQILEKHSLFETKYIS
jgi:hypothetical protein